MRRRIRLAVCSCRSLVRFSSRLCSVSPIHVPNALKRLRFCILLITFWQVALCRCTSRVCAFQASNPRWSPLFCILRMAPVALPLNALSSRTYARHLFNVLAPRRSLQYRRKRERWFRLLLFRFALWYHW